MKISVFVVALIAMLTFAEGKTYHGISKDCTNMGWKFKMWYGAGCEGSPAVNKRQIMKPCMPFRMKKVFIAHQCTSEGITYTFHKDSQCKGKKLDAHKLWGWPKKLFMKYDECFNSGSHASFIYSPRKLKK